MIATITKIDPLKQSRNDDTYFTRVYFKLEDGSWAKTDLCVNFRNYSRWQPLLKVGLMLENIELKSAKEVNADSYPRQYRTPVSGHWEENPDRTMKFVKDIEPDVKSVLVASQTEKKKTYNVALIESGYICDCPAFNYRGKCKHVAGFKKAHGNKQTSIFN